MNTSGVPKRIRKEAVVSYRNHEHNELVTAEVPAEDLTGHLQITGKATRLFKYGRVGGGVGGV
jgi:hypothetical protein